MGEGAMPARKYLTNFCNLYETYNRREYVHPDPLEFLYRYPDIRDREIVGLIAACLAYGSVHQILKTVGVVLKNMDRPYSFLIKSSRRSLGRDFGDFKYRFTTGEELASLLLGIKAIIKAYGSLGDCFSEGFQPEHDTVVPALAEFVSRLTVMVREGTMSLVPLPHRGSACKRLHLYLRWMVRSDDVDPGGWSHVPRSKLVVPVDVHMHRLSLRLGLTRRKHADIKTALEITSAFRAIEPHDPVKYDFALTRLGIRKDLCPDDFFARCADYDSVEGEDVRITALGS
ncbi:MAG: hypothetical protein QG577_2212 [Thermodesulfobacteriota bacterium]|nr:hypothetical protein [Thermodesulfobacteriota bacterium]